LTSQCLDLLCCFEKFKGHGEAKALFDVSFFSIHLSTIVVNLPVLLHPYQKELLQNNVQNTETLSALTASHQSIYKQLHTIEEFSV